MLKIALKEVKTTTTQTILRVILGLILFFAGLAHLFLVRQEFQSQVPDWFSGYKDLIIVSSGIIEIVLGLSVIFLKKHKAKVGLVITLYFVLIFPGNIYQYVNGIDALGLNSNISRFSRLFFQPVLILWALWSTGVLNYPKKKVKK